MWSFYNEGVGIQNYAPFPAEVITPILGSIIFGTRTNLSWRGSDIAFYDIYLGALNPSRQLKQNTTNTNIDSGTLLADTVYYWKVVTKDNNGGNSISPIFEFKTSYI